MNSAFSAVIYFLAFVGAITLFLAFGVVIFNTISINNAKRRDREFKEGIAKCASLIRERNKVEDELNAVIGQNERDPANPTDEEKKLRSRYNELDEQAETAFANVLDLI